MLSVAWIHGLAGAVAIRYDEGAIGTFLCITGFLIFALAPLLADIMDGGHR